MKVYRLDDLSIVRDLGRYGDCFSTAKVTRPGLGKNGHIVSRAVVPNKIIEEIDPLELMSYDTYHNVGNWTPFSREEAIWHWYLLNQELK